MVVESQVSEKLVEAAKFADSGKFSESLDSYLQAIELDSNDPRSWYCLGVVHHHLGNMDEAVTSFQKSDDLFPNHGATLANLAILLENGDPRAASEYATKAIIHFPDNSKLVDLAKAHPPVTSPNSKLFIQAKPIIVESDDELGRSFTASDSIDDKSSVIATAESLTKTGNHSKAVSLWKGLLEGSPDSSFESVHQSASLTLRRYQGRVRSTGVRRAWARWCGDGRPPPHPLRWRSASERRCGRCP